MKPDQLTEGDLIQIELANDVVLAAVLGHSRGLLEVVIPGGDVVRVKLNKLVRQSPCRLSSPQITHSPGDVLNQLSAEIASHADDIDLASIWELTVGDHTEPKTVEELTDTWFGEVTAGHFFAMAKALDADRLYFKERGAAYTPRNATDVETERSRQQAEERRAQQHRWLIDSVVAGVENTERFLEQLGQEVQLRNHVDVIMDFATYGEPYERKKDAQELLSEVSAAMPGRMFAGNPKGAFELLLALGVVTPHENLSLRRHGIRSQFAPDSLAQARALADVPLEVDGATVDLTDRLCFTIDDETTRDMDDALHLTRLPEGRFEVGIHITDVGALVQPGGPLDIEASRRGSSLYLPTGVIPMFPHVLSEDRLSLREDEQRLTLSFLFQVDPQGGVEGCRIVPAVVRIAHRLTYEEADGILEDPSHRMHEDLTSIEMMAEAYRQSRIEREAVTINLPEVKIRLRGDELTVKRVEESASRSLIADLMVLAGEHMALFCVDQNISTVFRCQDHRFDEQTLATVDALPPIVREIEMTRYMRRGELTSQPRRHMGLGLDAYVQATSPLRRYADLVVNYQVRRYLRGEPLCFDRETIVAIAAKAEMAAQECQAAQRETQQYWLYEYLRRHQGEPLDALVLFRSPQASRSSTPILLMESSVRTQVAARNLEPGQHIQVVVTQADPRRDLLVVEWLK